MWRIRWCGTCYHWKVLLWSAGDEPISPLHPLPLYPPVAPLFRMLQSLAPRRVTALVRPCHLFDARVSFSCTPCSSEQSAKAKTQKELFKTLKELKMHLPSEKRSKGKSSTINTLKYALRCVKQVKGKTRFRLALFFFLGTFKRVFTCCFSTLAMLTTLT